MGDAKRAKLEIPVGNNLAELQANFEPVVAAGGLHTVLLRSDGCAIAFGENQYGQCAIPALDGEKRDIQVVAGQMLLGLLKSDGSAIICGKNEGGRCTIPDFQSDLSYGAHDMPRLVVPLQVTIESNARVWCSCSNIRGVAILGLEARPCVGSMTSIPAQAS